jgi:hypothetical protein
MVIICSLRDLVELRPDLLRVQLAPYMILLADVVGVEVLLRRVE